MIRALSLMGVVLGLCISTARGQEEEESVRIYRQLQPSVVGLKNPEGSGTGVVLDTQGLILTNAHVVVSPLPMQAEVEVREGDNFQKRVFKNVQVVGLHPKLDLALLRINPSEAGVELQPIQLAKQKGIPGQRVYAIGDPGAGGVILSKTITSGMLSAVDRVLDDVPYYQFSAPINPGNSGGPLCDKTGMVLGLVTWKMSKGEGLGFAIPLDKLDISVFKPLAERKADPQRAARILFETDKMMLTYGELVKKWGQADPRAREVLYCAIDNCRTALSLDPGNASIYHRLGLLMGSLGAFEAAGAYMARCIQIAPWDWPDGHVYMFLAIALSEQGKATEALATRMEGIRKFPRSGVLWSDLSRQMMDQKKYFRAAEFATVALLLRDRHNKVPLLHRIYSDARTHLASKEVRELDSRIQPEVLVKKIQQLQDASDQARAARKLYITEEFTAVIKETGGPEYADAAKNIPPRPVLKAIDTTVPGAIVIKPSGDKGGVESPTKQPALSNAGD